MYAEALGDYSSAIAGCPDNSKYYVNRAYVWEVYKGKKAGKIIFWGKFFNGNLSKIFKPFFSKKIWGVKIFTRICSNIETFFF